MTYSAEVLADSPLLYWRLGDTSGTTAVDTSGNSRAGTYGGTYTLNQTGLLVGDANPCVDFATGYASINSAVWMDVNFWTAEAWVRPDSVTGDRTILMRDNIGAAGSISWRLRTSGNKAQAIVRANGATNVATGATVLAIGTTYHLAASYDGTTLRVYVNGVQDGTFAVAGVTQNNTSGIRVGTLGNGTSEPFDGKIDEAAFYGTVLTPTRLLAHYSAGSTAGTIVAGGLATETDTALASGLIITGGIALETDTPLAGSVFIPDATTFRTIGNDRGRDSVGFITWDPPVVEPPSPLLVTHDYVTAHAYTALDTTAAPRLTGLASASARRLRYRIVVAGRDLTFWRGVPTPEPTFSLVSPLLYGSGQLELPQVHAFFETPGEGDLDWLVPFAPVKVQLVDPDTGDVEHTIYRGFLLDAQIDGRDLVFGLMGQASGPASLDYRPPRVFRRWNDLGHWWWGALRDVRVRQVRNASTGIKMQNRGGMVLLDYMQELSAVGITRGGAQWTAMPDEDNRYHVARKDRTTVHATVYFDDTHAVPSLKRDPAEEPNTIYATAVSKRGRRIRFVDAPGLQLLDPRDKVPYPGFTLSEGDSGDAVVALIGRLWQVGYLSFEDRPGGFDADVTRAVRDLQDDAGLTENGIVNEATWKAMYDFEVTGYNLAGAQQMPAAQTPKTRRYKRTPSGAILGNNPSYDPHEMVVARSVDMGVGFTQNQVREFARTLIVEGAAANWTGTITLAPGEFAGGIGVILGEHTPGAAIDASDVVDPRLLQPGMNIWAPLFDGGTLFHIGGNELKGSAGAVLSVDTRARDTMEVWEVINRNRESRRNPARSWLKEFRSSYNDKDAVTEYDDLGGLIADTELVGGQWNIVAMPGAGQEGTVARLRLQLSDDAGEYVTALFGRKIGKGHLGGIVGNPLTEAGSERWTDADVTDGLRDSHVLLYVAGDDSQPCGYFPKSKGDDGASITGRWDDDAGAGYRTFDDYCLWLAIYPAEDCTLQGGRIMWNQLESGA